MDNELGAPLLVLLMLEAVKKAISIRHHQPGSRRRKVDRQEQRVSIRNER
jgi:hypothetical protein